MIRPRERVTRFEIQMRGRPSTSNPHSGRRRPLPQPAPTLNLGDRGPVKALDVFVRALISSSD